MYRSARGEAGGLSETREILLWQKSFLCLQNVQIIAKGLRLTCPLRSLPVYIKSAKQISKSRARGPWNQQKYQNDTKIASAHELCLRGPLTTKLVLLEGKQFLTHQIMILRHLVMTIAMIWWFWWMSKSAMLNTQKNDRNGATTLARLHNASHVIPIYALHQLRLEIGDLVASKLWDLWQFLFFAVKITYTVQGLACSLISIQNRWERVRWLPLWRKTWLCARISAYNEQWWRSALEYTQNILTEMHGNQRQRLNTQWNDPSNVSSKRKYVALVVYI